MKVISVSLVNIGPYKSVSVDFATEGLSAITGPNGKGKTFLAEAPFASLRSTFPSYRGDIFDAVRIGSNGKGSINATFETPAGDTIRAERLIFTGNRDRQEQRIYDASGAVIAGPKKADFDKYVKDVFGSKEESLSTWFCSYGRIGDLCNINPSERSDLIAQYIDSSDYTTIGKAGKSLSDQHRVKANTISEMISKMTQYDEDELSIRHTELKNATDRLNDCDRTITAYKEEQVAIGKEKDAIFEKMKEATAYAEISNRIELSRVTTDQALSALESIDTIVQDEPDLLDRYSNALHLIGEIDRATAWSSWYEKRKQLDEEKLREEANLSLFAGTKDQGSLNDSISSAQAERVQLDALVKKTELQLDVLRKSLSLVPHASQDALHRPEVLATACSDCALYAKAESAYEDREKNILARTDLQKKISESENKLSGIRIKTALIIESIATYQSEQKQHASNLSSLLDIKARLNSVTTRIELHTEQEPEAPSVSTEHLDPHLERSKLSDVQSRLTRIYVAREQRVDKENIIKLAKTDLERLEAEQAGLRKPDPSAVQDYKRLQDRSDTSIVELKKKEDERFLLSVQKENALSNLNIFQDNTAKRRELSESRDEATRQSALYWIIESAFGKSGIQALLVESAIKPFEQVASEIIREASGDQMDLRIETMRLSKTGDKEIEQILFLVKDKTGERDVFQFSGGERTILSTLIRLAFCEWISKRANRKGFTVFIDEAFDSLDSMNRTRLVEMLKRISDRFNGIVVLSPVEIDVNKITKVSF